MSSAIDQRVVSMQFDNKHFESNVKTSLSTLDKLKQSLNLTGAAKGLDKISASAKKVDMSPISNATETVGLKFNAMYTMADQALRNITNSAMIAGKRIVDALTIDPIKTGFSEYETKIGSIQTIMSNTASKGTTMADVTRVIDELNTYADKTIYNFAEMTRNIGTFTAAGVGLEESAAAIKGIANLAAASGSTSQQASTAMYQLSQALAAGTVKLMDWNSVVNAGMGGEKFQEALKATAREHGIAVDDIIKKNGSFRESLQEGWISADILNETLNKFTVDGAKNYAQSMMNSGKWTKEQADALIAEAQAMEDAATKVKTFTQLWDTLKESAQSGWGKTWELIVGDFDQAKELWTNVSEVFGGIIEKSSNARNNLLEGALTSNWDRLVKELNSAGVEMSEFEKSVKNVAKEHNVPIDKLIEDYGSFEKALRSGAVSADIMKEAVDKLAKSEVDLSKAKAGTKKGAVGEDVKQIQKALQNLGIEFKYGADGKFGKYTEGAVKEFQKLHGLKVTGIVDEETLAALEKANSKAAKLRETVKDLIDGITELGGREKLIESFKNIFGGLAKILKPIGQAFRDIFPAMKPKQLYDLIDGFQKLTERFKNFFKSTAGEKVLDNLGSTFKGFFSVIDIGLTIFKELGKGAAKLFGSVLGLGGGVLAFTGKIGDGLTAIRNWIKETGIITAAVEGISLAIQNGIQIIKKFGSFIKNEFVSFLKTESPIGDYFAEGIKRIKEFIDRVKSMKSFSLEDFETVFKDFKDNVVDYFLSIDIEEVVTNVKNSLKKFKDDAGKYLDAAGEKFGGIIEKIANFAKAVKENIVNNLGGILALGALVSFFLVIKKIKDAIELLVKPFDFLDDLADGLKSFMGTLKFNVKTVAIKNIAIALAILAGSLTVLAMLPYGKLWSAVGAIVVMSGALAGVIFVLSKVSDNLGDLAKLSAAILTLAGSLLVFAIAAKIISGIEGGDLAKTALVIGGFVGVIAALSKLTNTIGAGSIKAFGKTMMGLSGALLIMSIAVGILGNMKTDTLIQGGIAVGVFLGMMAGMMKATSLLEKYIPKFAGAMAGLSASLLIMSVAVGILGNMDTGTLLKGGAAVGVFLAMMAGMMKATNLLNKDMPKFGSTMMGLSLGLLAIASSAKIIASIDNGDLVKGGIVIAAFLAMFAGMMKATQMLTKNSANAAKVGAMILSFAGAMVLLTGAIAILSVIKASDIAKAVAAIGAVALIFGGLVAITKFAKVGKGVKTTIIAMATAIGVIALSLAALSLVDSGKLAGARNALSMVIGMFALLAASTKFIGTKVIGKLVIMTAMVGALAGILYMLSGLPAEETLGIAKALSLLIASLSASCVLLGALGSIGPAAFIGVGVLAALLGVVALFAGIAVASLPTIGKKLSEFMTNLKPFVEGAKSITPSMASGLKTLAEAFLIFTGVGLVNALTFGTPLNGLGKQFKDFGKGLSEFSESISGATFDTDKIKAAAEAAKALSGVSITLSKGTSFIDWLTGQGDLSKFGDTLGQFGSGLVAFNKAVGSDDFAVDKIESAAKAAESLAGVSITLAKGTSFIDWLTGQGDLSDFGSTLGQFGEGLSQFNKSAGAEEFDSDKIQAAVDAAQALVGVSISLAEGTSFIDWITGQGDLSTFGESLSQFGAGLSSFNKAVGSDDFDVDKIKAASTAAESLAGISISLAEGTSFIDWVTGQSDLSNFGSSLSQFGSGLSAFNSTVSSGEFDVDKIKSAAKAAEALAGVSISLAEGTSFIDWVTGQSDLSTFGATLGQFGAGLVAFNTAIGTNEFDSKRIKKVAEAAQTLAGVSITLAEGTSFIDWISGQSNLGTFGSSLSQFGAGLVAFNTTVGTGEFDVEKIKKVASAAEALAGVSITLGEGVSFIDWVTGQTNLATFGSTLGQFGTGLVAFNTAVGTGEFDVEKIKFAAKAAEALAGVSITLAEGTSFIDWITGQGDLSTFGSTLGQFGAGLVAFSKEIGTTTFDEAKLTSAINAAKSLAEIGGVVGENSSGWDWLTGKDSLGDFGTNLKTLGSGLAGFASSMSSEEIDMTILTEAVDQVSKLSDIATIISEGSYGSLSAFGTEISTLGGNISSFYSNISDVDASKLSSIVSAIQDLASINVSNADTLQSFIDSLGEVGTSGVDSFINSISNAAPKAGSAMAKLMQSAIKGATSRKRMFVAAFKGITSSAVDTVKGYHSNFSSAGGYLVEGFAAGITADTFKAEAAAAAMAEAALAAAKKALGIKSPSRKMMTVADFTIQGFVKGILKGASNIYTASQETAEYAKKGFSNALAKVSDLIANGIDDQPTIRPVLDLSDISAGADRINGMLDINPSIGTMSNVRAISSMMNRRQNGTNNDVISAIKNLGDKLENASGNNYYNVNGVTYDDGSNITDAVRTLVKAVTVEGRV